jgi:RNA polymerase sigma-70 factor (ECF subfamily)
MTVRHGARPGTGSVPTAGPTPAGGLTEVNMTAANRRISGGDRGRCAGHVAGHDDAELVTLAVTRMKEGDTTGLHFLYLRYRDDVRRCVYRILHDHHESEDVTQSVFLKVMFVIHAYQPRGIPFGAWLLRVARNAAIDARRARRALPRAELRLIDRGRDQAAFERCAALKRALAGLPAEQREVVILRYVAGLPAWEIADLLHKTQSSVEGLQHRGRRALKAALEELDATPLTA